MYGLTLYGDTNMKAYKLYWSPEGKYIGTVQEGKYIRTVQAKDTKSAKRKAPKPYRKYPGEIYAELVNL